MSHGSPGLDLNHGFIHVIRRHQLSEAEKLREEIANKQLASAQRRQQEIENSRKQKRPDAPLYSSGQTFFNQPNRNKDTPTPPVVTKSAPQTEVSTEQQTRSLPVSLPRQEMSIIDKVLSVADIDSYPLCSQDLLRQAIIDMCDVSARSLPEVAELIVERAYKDENYEAAAATICAHIVEAEYLWQECIERPRYVFRLALRSECMAVLDQWQDIGSSSKKAIQGRRFGYFLQLAYNQVKPGGSRSSGMLGPVMTHLLSMLLQDVKAGYTEELSVISSIFHESGAAMAETDHTAIRDMIRLMRDMLLHPDTQPQVRTMLLQILELYAGHCCYYNK